MQATSSIVLNLIQIKISFVNKTYFQVIVAHIS